MSKLSLIPLGGMGNVTQNMFLYHFGREILIVDCGIGFPDLQMPGVDIMIPDTTHLHELLEEGNEIVGMILTHGHDDHIAATPYILPELPEFPIFASNLTAGFATNRMNDGGVKREIEVIRDGQWYRVGQNFEFACARVTHSVPDTKHFVIRTPEASVYHGSDFKLDKNPVDGLTSDEATIKEITRDGIDLMLIDCLRVEKRTWVPSESETGPTLLREMSDVSGKVLVTLMSSHLHRIQQTIDAAVELGRKVVFVGRSVEQNVKIALELNYLQIPKGVQIDKLDIDDYKDNQLCIIIAGSQGQEGSSLVRAVFGEHQMVRITNQDKVIFSADAIPGNEVPFYQAIDELCRNRVDVVYPDIVVDLHESGHASAEEQQHLMELVAPEYVMPIGGADRHRVKFLEFVADPAGFARERVILPAHAEVLEIGGGEKPRTTHKVTILPRLVDGLGIGDVGPMVLSERKVLGDAGMIVIVLPKIKGRIEVKKLRVISRGFVFMKEAQEVIEFIHQETGKLLGSLDKKVKDDELKRKLEKKLQKKLYQIIRREPLILAEIVEI